MKLSATGTVYADSTPLEDVFVEVIQGGEALDTSTTKDDGKYTLKYTPQREPFDVWLQFSGNGVHASLVENLAAKDDIRFSPVLVPRRADITEKQASKQVSIYERALEYFVDLSRQAQDRIRSNPRLVETYRKGILSLLETEYAFAEGKRVLDLRKRFEDLVNDESKDEVLVATKLRNAADTIAELRAQNLPEIAAHQQRRVIDLSIQSATDEVDETIEKAFADMSEILSEAGMEDDAKEHAVWAIQLRQQRVLRRFA